MSTLLVTDTTGLIALDRAGHLDLIPRLYHPVVAPPAVVREFGRTPDWLRVEPPESDAAVAALLARALDLGEAETIALAQRLGPALLLIDEARGRRVAVALRLPIIGTAGLLGVAKAAGLIPAVKPVLDALIREHDFRLSERLYAAVLIEAGEA